MPDLAYKGRKPRTGDAWFTYVLVLKYDKGSWLTMCINRKVIADKVKADPDMYAMQKSHYHRLETGDVFMGSEDV